MSVEPEVVFNALSDRRICTVAMSNGETLFEISGYDLRIVWDKSKLKSLDDVENMLEGVKELFRKLVIEDLLPDSEKSAPPAP